MFPASERSVYLFVLPWSLKLIGGVNQAVIALASEMRDHGEFEPLILTSDWEATEPVFEHIKGLRTVRWRIRPYDSGAGLKGRISYALWQRKFRKAFHAFCREQNVKVVNAHYPGELALTLGRILASFREKIPLVLSFHGTDVDVLAKAGSARKEEWRAGLQAAQAVVTCSNDLARRLGAALDTDVRYQVIHNGINAAQFAKDAPGHVPGRSTILHVGKFDRNKGQDVLIDAFSRIAARFPQASLCLVGGKGDRLGELQTMVETLGIADRVRFFVDVPHTEIPSFFRDAGIFAFPSRQEGFSLVLLEAAAFRLPVVASSVGGIPELICDRETGLLVEPDDPAGLAAALELYLSEPALAREHGERLRQRVEEEFSWSHAVEAYEHVC
jgi:glycosyltransferase involved in cell wall biosynthesis